MINCHHCGKSNLQESNFCRYCGSKFGPQRSANTEQIQRPPQPQRQRQPATNPLDQQPIDQVSAPRPYSWKTDEYEVKNQDARQTVQFDNTQLEQFQQNDQSPRHLVPQGGRDLSRGYRCPRCSSTSLPYKEKRISTAGWIVFAALLIAFFPLFWIGFLIKEEILVCPVCNFKMTY